MRKHTNAAIAVVATVAIVAIVVFFATGTMHAQDSGNIVDQKDAISIFSQKPDISGNGSHGDSGNNYQSPSPYDNGLLGGETPQVEPQHKDADNEYHTYTIKGYNASNPDDGELHDGWNANAGYTYDDVYYGVAETKDMITYGYSFNVDFDVHYPQLSGIPNQDAVNEAIKQKALAFVNDAYINQSGPWFNQVKSDADGLFAYYAHQGSQISSDTNLKMQNEVVYAITYNNPHFISISFNNEVNDTGLTGSYLYLTTLNINLDTGQVYTLDDILTLSQDMAASWVDNQSKQGSDSNDMVETVGSDTLAADIMGTGPDAADFASTFFVDKDGRVNLNVDYRVTIDSGYQNGWWDVTLANDQIEASKKDSDFWNLL